MYIYICIHIYVKTTNQFHQNVASTLPLGKPTKKKPRNYAIRVNAFLASYAGPGAWNDPDMLVGSSPEAACHMSLEIEKWWFPSKIEWDLTKGTLSKLLELLDTQVWGSVQWVLLEISWMIRFEMVIFVDSVAGEMINTNLCFFEVNWQIM